MILPVNTLVKDRATGTVFRILAEIAALDSKDTTATHYVVIDVNAKDAAPRFIGKQKILRQIADEQLCVVAEIFDSVNLDGLTVYDKKLLERRWQLIGVVQKLGHRIWDPRQRGELARQLAEAKSFSKPLFYEVLRLYWQRGQNKQAIVTSMWKCGAPGKRRVPTEDAPKPGRPRSINPGRGLSATEIHRTNMKLAWSSAPVGRDGRNLRKAWDWMLINQYHEHVTVKPKDKSSHELIINNYDRVPTFEQFEYHWRQEYPFEVRMLKRMQQRRFDLAFKPLLTGTLTEVRGPGTRYYVDATVLDVYAVSRLDPRRIVGRPTLYVIVDQFSRLIVGIYVGLEPPCWAGAMLALWHCSIDKVEYCRSYGIEIQPEDWPTGYMPLHLMGDRAELTSNDSNRLVTGFNLDVENSAPYRGDAKGVGERVFKTLHATFGPFLPGYIDKEFIGRGLEPAVLRSAMTIDAITRVVIHAVLHANLRVVRQYEGWPEVIADGTPFVPVSLWRWGVENLRADVRRFPDLDLKKYLWPQDEMKTTKRGLHMYRGLYYMGDELRRQAWFVQALHREYKVPVVYHPLIANSAVALPLTQNGTACEVTLTRRSQRFANAGFSELAALEHKSKTTNAAAQWSNLPERLRATSLIIDESAHSRRAAEKAKPPGETIAERTRDIRGNRDKEIALQTSDVFINTTGIDQTGHVVEAASVEPASPVEESTSKTTDQVRQIMEARRLRLSKPS